MSTPIVDRCAERGSDLGAANEMMSRIWPTARRLEELLYRAEEIMRVSYPIWGVSFQPYIEWLADVEKMRSGK